MPPRAEKKSGVTPKPNGRPAKKVEPEGAGGREVVYPEVECRIASGDDPITVELAKELLGWCEDEAQAKSHGVAEPHLLDRKKQKVWLLNNVTNRPIYPALYEAYDQEILNKRWSGPNGNGETINGENIIIGRTGLVLNGQHTLIALCLAEQDRTADRGKYHWEQFWKGPVVVDKSIMFGISEKDAVVNTMDTCKPRSFSDVIYRSEFFRDAGTLTQGAIANLSKILDAAVRTVWERTGAGSDPWHPRRTHSEGLDFIKRHPQLLDAVRWIAGENEGGALRKVYPVGGAAALLYMMGTGATDVDAYRNGDPPREEFMDFSQWDQAKEFWALLGGGSKKLSGVRQAMARLYNPGDLDETDRFNKVSRVEETAVIVKAWHEFLKHGEVTDPDHLRLEYTTEGAGEEDSSLKVYTLNETPSCGGIDLGNPKADEPAKETTPKEKKARGKTGGTSVTPKSDTPEGLQTELAQHKEAHGGRTLLFAIGSGVIAHGPDAKEIGKITGKKPAKSNDTGLLRLAFPSEELEKILVQLVGHGLRVAVLKKVDGALAHEYYPTDDRVEGQSGPAGGREETTEEPPVEEAPAPTPTNGAPRRKFKAKPKAATK